MSVENLKAKAAIIDEIKSKLDGAQSAVVVDYMGTTVEENTAIRKSLREAGVDFTVYKNTLIAKFMGSIQSPVGKFVRTLAAIAEAKEA